MALAKRAPEKKNQVPARMKALLVAYAVIKTVRPEEANDFQCLLLLGVLGKLSDKELDRRFKNAVKRHRQDWDEVQRSMFPDGALYRKLRSEICGGRKKG